MNDGTEGLRPIGDITHSPRGSLRDRIFRMRALVPDRTNPTFPAGFVPLAGTAQDCDACGRAERVGFDFDFAYQPIVDLRDGSVFAHEALVRGPNGEGAGSVLSQVSEHNRYRFDQACRVKAIKGAKALGIQQAVSINFLPNAIYKPELCIRTTLEAARVHGFPLDKIIFEVTEGERVEDGPWFAEILREYQRRGFKTAIDDFGAGFAGLKLLADFQPDYLKLDMDLVRHIDADKPRQAIVCAVVRMCEPMGIQVIAEGIETLAERDVLFDMGIHLMQGYLFARPAFRATAALSAQALSLTR
jgi:EAL domain-containing protein (putative c-di-GMP-specific phosphodiesterase class I)